MKAKNQTPLEDKADQTNRFLVYIMINMVGIAVILLSILVALVRISAGAPKLPNPAALKNQPSVSYTF